MLKKFAFINVRNWFHVAVVLFNNRSQMKSVLNYFLIDIYFCTNYSMNEIDKTSDQTRSHFILSHILNLLFPNWHAVSVPIAIFSCNFISCTRIYLSGTIVLYYLYFSLPLMSNCRFLSYFNFRFYFVTFIL